MRKTRLLRAAAAASACVLLASGCGSDDSDESSSEIPGGEALTELGENEDALTVLGWPGYLEDGSTNPDIDWVTPFEEETGCQVETKIFATSNEAVTLFQGGQYDVVSASGDASLRLIYGDDVQPVNLDLVPNYADIIPELKDQPWNSIEVDGEQVNYGVPHGRGANLLLYTAAEYPTAPTSWADMWEADSPIAGKISPYDDAIYIADAALYLKATQPDLGIDNPYALNQEQFDAAIALLEQQKPLVAEYWGDVVKQASGLASGSVVQSQGWQLTANIANTEGAVVGTTKPEEGATGWSDTWMIKAGTDHPNCAYAWLDWVASPEVNAQIAEYFGEAPANRESCALTENPNHCADFHAEESDFWDDVWYWTTPTEECVDGRDDTCVGYEEWVSAWSALRSG